MSFSGLLVDLSWERKLLHGAPYLGVLVASPSGMDGSGPPFAEILIPEREADGVRARITRRVHVLADFKGDMFYAGPADVADLGPVDLPRLASSLGRPPALNRAVAQNSDQTIPPEIFRQSF